MSVTIDGRIPPKSQGFSARKERWLQAILEDQALPRNAIRVAAAIAKFLNAKSSSCWPSVATLAGIARFVDRTIQRLLSALEAAGYLRISRQAGAHGCNVYEAILPGQIAEGSALSQGDNSPAPKPRSEKIPDIVWISKDSPEWETAAAAWRRDHRKAPPIDKRGGWWFARHPLHESNTRLAIFPAERR